jgi:hypothetical protein
MSLLFMEQVLFEEPLMCVYPFTSTLNYITDYETCSIIQELLYECTVCKQSLPCD